MQYEKQKHKIHTDKHTKSRLCTVKCTQCDKTQPSLGKLLEKIKNKFSIDLCYILFRSKLTINYLLTFGRLTITSISANADGLRNAASCKIDHIMLHTEYNYQAMCISR